MASRLERNVKYTVHKGEDSAHELPEMLRHCQDAALAEQRRITGAI